MRSMEVFWILEIVLFEVPIAVNHQPSTQMLGQAGSTGAQLTSVKFKGEATTGPATAQGSTEAAPSAKYLNLEAQLAMMTTSYFWSVALCRRDSAITSFRLPYIISPAFTYAPDLGFYRNSVVTLIQILTANTWIYSRTAANTLYY